MHFFSALSQFFSVLRTGIVACLLSLSLPVLAANNQPQLKILHVMSYHTPWRWTEGQLEGFKLGLAVETAQYKVIELDTKRKNSKTDILESVKRAKRLIHSWKPDLVYTTDDDVQNYLVRDYVGSAIPFVFSGVNRSPEEYGFTGDNNVTGVVEHEHFVESVKMLRGIVPEVKRIAVVFDNAPLWPAVRQRMKKGLKKLPGVEIINWDTIDTYKDYQRKIKAYQGTVDALALVGIFNFKDDSGSNVPYQEVLRWTEENSRLPDLSFWVDRVHHGALVAVTVSSREQGKAAGRIARTILIDGKSPASIEMKPTSKGVPVISLARAKRLGIKVRSGYLLSSQVIKGFEWNK